MAPSKIKIALADDELLFRKGIAFLLQREKNLEIIFEASNGSELITYLKEQPEQPDIILMDLKMPMLNGVEATKVIHKMFPGIRIIALTSYNTKPFIANMIQVGAVSFIVKNATPQEVIHTINEVDQKGFYYSPEVMKIIHDDMLTKKTTRSNLDTEYLTAREIKILELICEQKSTIEIGEVLFISPRTVEGHRNNLLIKTESRNIAGLVVYAIQNKIVTLNIAN
ncbi:response regulator transcription factor [Flavobacterium pallidum]|uniref:DNA-binding response regulator n=1 Tax=Flavobacterium pallidum TaxID=2172098 RepID=A0A2S1SH86_9FLAO|nr:response regulator transcription factor [Flavobacterium pallidum]AWI25774.1 DNA-binding response regulator [Flavobacterium pallidum]